MEQGFVHIYFGDGKGKTTAALGLALRCAGRGFRVGYTAFLKNGDSGEFLQSLPFTVFKPGCKTDFWCRMNEVQRREVSAESAERLEYVFEKADSQSYDMLVLDEVLDAAEVGCITYERLAELLSGRKKGLEVVMTGRRAPQILCDAADYITEMKNIKHPYSRGIAARKGIEL